MKTNTTQKNPIKTNIIDMWDMIKCNITDKSYAEKIELEIGWKLIDKSKQLHDEFMTFKEILQDVEERTNASEHKSKDSNIKWCERDFLLRKIDDLLQSLGTFGYDILHQYNFIVYEIFRSNKKKSTEYSKDKNKSIRKVDFIAQKIQMNQTCYMKRIRNHLGSYQIEGIVPQIRQEIEKEHTTLERCIQELRNEIEKKTKILMETECINNVPSDTLKFAVDQLEEGIRQKKMCHKVEGRKIKQNEENQISKDSCFKNKKNGSGKLCKVDEKENINHSSSNVKRDFGNVPDDISNNELKKYQNNDKSIENQSLRIPLSSDDQMKTNRRPARFEEIMQIAKLNEDISTDDLKYFI